MLSPPQSQSAETRVQAAPGIFQTPNEQSLAEERRQDGEFESAEKAEYEDEEPRYGWVTVACVFVINAHTWGLTGSFSVFLAHYLNSGEFPNADPLTLAFVASLAFSTTLFVAPIATHLIPRIGTKPTVMIGIVIQTLALISASFSTQIWHLVLSQGLAFGAGVGMIVNTAVNIVPQWFVRRRSFAVAITTGGSGFGGLLYSLTSNLMIRRISLPWAFRILAVISFVVNTINCFFLKDRNKKLGSVHAAFQMAFFKRPEFYLFLAWGFFSQAGFGVTMFSLADFAQTMGFSSDQASVAAAMFQLSQGLGRPAIGFASDRFGRINIAGLTSLSAGLSSLFIWTFAGRYFAGTIVYALLGAFTGSMWTTVTPVGVEIFGIQLLPSALSIYWLVLVLPTTFAMPISLSIKSTGVDGYLNIQLFTGFMFIGAFLSVWALRAWKLREGERTSSTTSTNEDTQQHNNLTSVRTNPRPALSSLSSLLKGLFVIAKI